MRISDFSQLTEYEPINVVDKMRETILIQYNDSPNLLSYIEALLAPFQELEDTFNDILNLRILTNANGDQLDILGELVGQERSVYNTAVELYFGMDPVGGQPVAHGGLGDSTDTVPGGTLRSVTQPVASRAYLDDLAYRKVILAKAWKNTYLRSVENLIVSLQILFDLEDGAVEVVSDFTVPTDPFATVTIHRVLSGDEKSIIQLTDIVPVPGGHRYEYKDSNGPI